MSKILLLADDSVVIRKLVGLSFANEDVEVVTTDTGDDALARAREIQPDLVLADVVMPGKSGYEVCEAIKADASLRHIPVLLLTDTFEAFDEDRSRQAGSDGHITKPFETQSLVDRVMDLLSQAPASRTVATAELPSPLPEPAVRTEISFETPVTQAEASRDDAYEFFDDDTQADTAALELDTSTPPPLASEHLDDAFDFGLDLHPIDATDPIAGEADALDPNFDLDSNAPGDLGPVTHFEAGLDEPSERVLDDAADSNDSGYDVSSSDPGHPFTAPPASGRPGPDVSQVMRDRIHETLEKIAWEAFADVSDSIVRQVLERVESIVWEVVPQMAEALVREEIRRIKGDD